MVQIPDGVPERQLEQHPNVFENVQTGISQQRFLKLTDQIEKQNNVPRV